MTDHQLIHALDDEGHVFEVSRTVYVPALGFLIGVVFQFLAQTYTHQK